MVGNTPSLALVKGSVNAGAADVSNDDTLPASFEELEAAAAAVSAAVHRNPALKRNVWGDGVGLEEPASRRPLPTEEAEALDSPVPLTQRAPEALESPFPWPSVPHLKLWKAHASLSRTRAPRRVTHRCQPSALWR